MVWRRVIETIIMETVKWGGKGVMVYDGIFQDAYHDIQPITEATSFRMRVGRPCWPGAMLVFRPDASSELSHSLAATSFIARIMGPIWSPYGADRTQVGPMLAPWICYLGSVWISPLFPISECRQRWIWRLMLPVWWKKRLAILYTFPLAMVYIMLTAHRDDSGLFD